MALLLIIIAPNGHILANIAIVSQLSLAIDLSSKGLPGQLRLHESQKSGLLASAGGDEPGGASHHDTCRPCPRCSLCTKLGCRRTGSAGFGLPALGCGSV